MHDIEPYFQWIDAYVAADDKRSPLYGRVYDEFYFTNTIYNYYIHPQWDDFGSKTLYLKILFADYDQHYAIIELIGEWNDAIENDIMELRREVTDLLFEEGIHKFILIAENVLTQYDFKRAHLNQYIGLLNYHGWRASQPQHLFSAIDNLIMRTLDR